MIITAEVLCGDGNYSTLELCPRVFPTLKGLTFPVLKRPAFDTIVNASSFKHEARLAQTAKCDLALGIDHRLLGRSSTTPVPYYSPIQRRMNQI